MATRAGRTMSGHHHDRARRRPINSSPDHLDGDSELHAQRQMAWTESTNRASMFMTIVGAAVFGLALVGNATRFDTTFLLLVAPGPADPRVRGRLEPRTPVGARAHDWILMQGLNRLRRLRVELDPTIGSHLMQSVHDDFESVLDGYGPANPKLHSFWTLRRTDRGAGGRAGRVHGWIIAIAVGLGAATATAVGVVTFAAVMLLMGLVGYRSFSRAAREWVSESLPPSRRPPTLRQRRPTDRRAARLDFTGDPQSSLPARQNWRLRRRRTRRSIGAGGRRRSPRSSPRTRSSRRCAMPSGSTGWPTACSSSGRAAPARPGPRASWPRRSTA